MRTCSRCGGELDDLADVCPGCLSQPQDWKLDWRMNPFASPAPTHWGVEYTVCCGVSDRLDMVRKFNIDECLRALRVLGLQITVRNAILRRLKALGWKAEAAKSESARQWINPV